jgi:hypothetical protein
MVFIASQLAMPVATYFSQEQIRKEQNRIIRKGLSRELLTRLVLKDVQSKLDWDDAEEFTFDGMKYDLVETTIENQQRIIYCLADTKETSLLINNAKAHGARNSVPGKHVPVFKSLEYTNQQKHIPGPTHRPVLIEYALFKTGSLPLNPNDPAGPPPRLA